MRLSVGLKCTYILFIVCVLKKTVFVEGDYIFSIQLISYSNPENRLASGTCCDGSEEAGSCPAPCNTTLRMCFRNANQSRDDPGCPIQEIIGDSAPRGLNPFIQGSWPGGVQLHISVTSKNATESELIDNFFIELDITANDPLSPSREYSGENETAVMRLSFRVACAFNYFGLDCNTFCMDRNDTAAHFTCGESGEIVCLQGYQNESSNCTQCAPAEGCSTANGFCTAPGECRCREGWRGEQCSECIPSEGCSPTGGFCVQPGECECQPGYSGENCTIGPIPSSTPTVPPSSTLMPSLTTISSSTVPPSSTLMPSLTTISSGTVPPSSTLMPSLTTISSSTTGSSSTSVVPTAPPEILSTHSSTRLSLTTPGPVATPFIVPGVGGTILRDDSSSLVLLIVGLTVGGGLVILLSAGIFLIILGIMVYSKKRKWNPKRRRFTNIVYETHTADTRREGTMQSPRYIDHSSENRSPAFGLLAHAVARLGQPPPNRNSFPDPTYSTFQDDTASGQETSMTSTTELWDEGEDYPEVAGTPSEETALNQSSAEGIYTDEEKFDLSLHQTPGSGEEDSDIDFPVISNPGATHCDDAALPWDQHQAAAEESTTGDPHAKDILYADLDHQPTHFELRNNVGQMTVHQAIQGPTPPVVTYADVLHNGTPMTIKSIV